MVHFISLTCVDLSMCVNLPSFRASHARSMVVTCDRQRVLKSQMTWELQHGVFLLQAGCCLVSVGLGKGVLDAGL